MSGLFEQRPDGADRRQTRALKEQKAKKKTRLIAVTVVTILALLFAGAMFVNSKLIRRTVPAVTISGVNFSAAEFDYFFRTYMTEYQNRIYSQMGENAESVLPSNEVPLSTQIRNYETGETWADFFTDLALQNMSRLAQIYNAAKAAGFVLPPEGYEEVEYEINTLKLQGEEAGFPSFSSLLQQYYGSSMNEGTLRKITEFVMTTRYYDTHIRESFSYQPWQLNEYYADNADMLDSFMFRYLLIESVYIDREWYETDEEYDAAVQFELNEVMFRADEIAEGINNEFDFINAAREYNDQTYASPNSTLMIIPGSWLAEESYGSWVSDESRAYGDLTIEDMGNGTGILFYVGRDKNEYEMVNMRQILVLPNQVDPANFDEGELAPDYIQAKADADELAGAMAKGVYDQFVEGGATEGLLLELMEAHSDDPTEGGLYEGITKSFADNKMYQEIEDWLFAPGRKAGDHELIQTDGLGYHIIFFVGTGERYCDSLAEKDMMEKDYQEWIGNLAEVQPVKRWAFRLTQQQ